MARKEIYDNDRIEYERERCKGSGSCHRRVQVTYVYDGAGGSGFTRVEMSCWFVGYISAASDTGMIHNAFDWRNCMAAPTSSSISLATSLSVSSFDQFSQIGWLLPLSLMPPYTWKKKIIHDEDIVLCLL